MNDFDKCVTINFTMGVCQSDEEKPLTIKGYNTPARYEAQVSSAEKIGAALMREFQGKDQNLLQGEYFAQVSPLSLGPI